MWPGHVFFRVILSILSCVQHILLYNVNPCGPSYNYNWYIVIIKFHVPLFCLSQPPPVNLKTAGCDKQNCVYRYENSTWALQSSHLSVERLMMFASIISYVRLIGAMWYVICPEARPICGSRIERILRISAAQALPSPPSWCLST